MDVITEKAVVFDKLIASLILLVSVALFFVALPRARAALSYLSVDYVIEKINNKESLGDEDIVQAIEAAKASISVYDNPHYWEGLSVLFLYQLQKDDLSQEASVELLKQAKDSLEQSLLRSPANSYLWYRLAVVHILLDLPPERTVKMLIMSMTTGPNETGILMQRLGLCMNLFSSFGKDDIDLLRSQILTAWSLSPADFLKDVANDQRQMNIVRLLLVDNYATVLEEIEEAFEKTY